MNKHTIEQVAQRTGLKEATVRDLLEAGFTYIETLNTFPHWEKIL